MPGLIVVTPAVSQALTKLDTVNAELGFTTGADATRDALLTKYITDASGAINTFCRRRTFGRQTYQETQGGDGGQVLLLAETPLIQIRSLVKDNSAVTDYTIEDPDVGTLRRSSGWDLGASMGSPFRDWPLPGTENETYVIQYDGGYFLPSESGQWGGGALPAPALPPDVERACLLTVKDWYLRRAENPGQNIVEKSVDDLRIRYATDTVAVGQISTPAATLLHAWIRET